MALMAVIAVVFILKTVQFRRANDHLPEPPLPPAAATATPPGKLAGLGYLPADCTALAALHVAQLLPTDTGRTLLGRFGLSPDRPLAGVKLDEVDDVVLGGTLDRVPPRLTLVVRTRRPYDAADVRRELSAGGEVRRGEHDVYRFKPTLGGLAVELGVSSPDERTLLIGLVDDFEILPKSPAGGVERFPAPLPELVKARLPSGSLAWLAAQAESGPPALTTLLGGLGSKPPPEVELLSLVRRLAVSATLADGLTLRAAVLGRDSAAAKLDAALKKWGESLGVPVVVDRSSDGWLTATASGPVEKWTEPAAKKADTPNRP
jgi:hypothetical protein